MKIKVAAAQYPLSQYPDLQSWKIQLTQWVKNAVELHTNLLVFPEFASMELVYLLDSDIQKQASKQAEAMQIFLPEFLATFAALTKQFNTIIIAPSFPVKEHQQFFNRAFVFSAKGLIGYQDKFFITQLDKALNIQSPPKRLSVFDAGDFKFGIQLCYDSEFSIGSHFLAQNGIELLLIPSCTETNRGASRVHLGARARAMEQQFFSVVAQIVGEANWHTSINKNYGYAGFYSAPDKTSPPEGIIATGKAQEVCWVVQDLDIDLVKKTRESGQMSNFNEHQSLSQNFIGENITVEVLQVN